MYSFCTILLSFRSVICEICQTPVSWAGKGRPRSPEIFTVWKRLDSVTYWLTGDSNNIGGRGLEQVALRLRKLRVLWIRFNDITNGHATVLLSMKNLRQLGARNTKSYAEGNQLKMNPVIKRGLPNTIMPYSW